MEQPLTGLAASVKPTGGGWAWRRVLSWLPLPVLLAATALLLIRDVPSSHESPYLLLALNFIFAMLVSLLVAYLAARAFLINGKPELLILGCGVLLWGCAAIVASALVQRGANVPVTIHNLGVVLSAFCHLGAAVLRIRSKRTVGEPGLWLAAAYTCTVGVTGLVAISTLAGWTPVFFIQSLGGTTVRQVGLGMAIGMFLITAGLMGAEHHKSPSAFLYWYAIGLALLAVGLFGVMMQSAHASFLGWTGRTAQNLGGAYVLIAAIAAVRESRVWGFPLETVLRDTRARLEEQIERYELVLAGAGAALWDWDVPNKRVLFSSQWKTLRGLSDEEVGDSEEEWSSRIHPEDKDRVFSSLQAHFDGKTSSFSEEYRIRCIDGSWKWISDRGVARRDAAGRVVRMAGSEIDISERKQVEEQLKKTLESIGDGFFACDKDWCFVFVNAPAERILGIRREEVLGRSHWEIFPLTMDTNLEREYRRAAAGEIRDFENFYEPWGRWFHNRCYPREGGGMSVFFQDITERKVNEKRIEEENREITLVNRILRVFAQASDDELFDQVLDIVQQGLASRHGVFGYISEPEHLICPSLSRMLDECEVADKCIHYPPEKWKGLWARAIREKRSFYTNEPSEVPSGHIAIRNNLAAPILFRGEAIGLLNLANKESDYTETDRALLEGMAERIAPLFYAWIQKKLREDERAKAEEKLRQSEQRLRLALEAAYVISFEWDIQANEVRRFVSADLVLTATPEQAPSTFEAVREVVHPDDRERFSANVLAAMDRKDGRYENEFRIVQPDGRIHWLYERGYVDRDAQGRAARLIGLSQDITERKRSEETLKQLNEILEQQVSERTKLAENRAKQLRSLVSELTLTEQRERRRLAEILHDHLQQLLVGAKINCEVISARIGTKHKQIAENVLNLLNQSIQASRSLTAELSPPVLQQGRLSAALAWLARRMKETHDLTVGLQADPAMDPKREDITILLYQSVRELLLNVVKHAGVKSARVEMTHDEQNRLCVAVSDQGHGLDLETIWDRVQTGSGFGLFTIRERLELLGGSLEIESSPGHGATFSLIVPLETTGEEEEKGIEKIFTEIRKTKSSGDKIRVLLADDHTVVRQGLFTLLNQHADIEVVGEAADGEEAVERARKLQPDVILMDISMPKMDGLEATRIIHSELPHIRIIGLSMHEKDDQAARMIEAGAFAYRSKSDNTDLLLAAIRGEND